MKLGRNDLGALTTAGRLVAVGEPGVTWLLMEREDGSRYMAAANSEVIEKAVPMAYPPVGPDLPTPYERRLLPCPFHWSKRHKFLEGEPSGRGMGFDAECACGAVSNRYPVY